MTDDQVHKKSNVRSWSVALRRSRRMQGMGGLVLAVSCLFPAVDGCGSPYVPAKEIWQVFESTPFRLDVWLWVMWIGTPYVVGLAFLGMTIRWRGRLLHRERCIGGSVVWLLVLWTGTAVIPVVQSLTDQALGPFEDPAFLVYAGVSVYSVAYLLAAIRNPAAGRLCARWLTGVCCSLWFGGWFVGQTVTGSPTYYGLWLSLTGSMSIVAGTFQEAKIVSFTKWIETLIGLLTCRLRMVDPEEPRCGVCGYLLKGLPTNRCPECGTAFELGSDDPKKERVPGAGDAFK